MASTAPTSEIPEEAKTWKMIYPCYVNSERKRKEGRRLGKERCCKNPTIQEMSQVCEFLKLRHMLEPAKRHPRDWEVMGRIRVELKDASGAMKSDTVTSKSKLLEEFGRLIPKLASRVSASKPVVAAKKKKKKKRR